MNASDAKQYLSEIAVVIGAEGAIVEVRSLLARCLAENIPAMIGPCPEKT